LEESRKGKKKWREIEKEGLWEERRDWRVFLYKMETLLGEGERVYEEELIKIKSHAAMKT
jgi:hypothetical protein